MQNDNTWIRLVDSPIEAGIQRLIEFECVGRPHQVVLWGDGDLVVPRACVTGYADALPRAQLAEIPGVGHRPEIEDPDAFLEAVTKFLGI